jgi:hypothetical protein
MVVYRLLGQPAHKVQSTQGWLVEDIRGFYDWITQAEGLLFPIATKHQIAVLGLDAFEVCRSYKHAIEELIRW